MAKENSKKDKKNKKHFWKDFRAELKKVIWPTPKQLFKNTVAVIFIVLLTAAIVFVLDVAFEALNNKGINRIKSSITNTVSVEETSEEALEEGSTEEQTEETEVEVEGQSSEETETAEE